MGSVGGITQIPNENKYQIKIKLPKQLITSYQQKITYTPETQGTAEIITKDLRLLERIFNQFRTLFD